MGLSVVGPPHRTQAYCARGRAKASASIARDAVAFRLSRESATVALAEQRSSRLRLSCSDVSRLGNRRCNRKRAAQAMYHACLGAGSAVPNREMRARSCLAAPTASRVGQREQGEQMPRCRIVRGEQNRRRIAGRRGAGSPMRARCAARRAKPCRKSELIGRIRNEIAGEVRHAAGNDVAAGAGIDVAELVTAAVWMRDATDGTNGAGRQGTGCELVAGTTLTGFVRPLARFFEWTQYAFAPQSSATSQTREHRPPAGPPLPKSVLVGVMQSRPLPQSPSASHSAPMLAVGTPAPPAPPAPLTPPPVPLVEPACASLPPPGRPPAPAATPEPPDPFAFEPATGALPLAPVAFPVPPVALPPPLPPRRIEPSPDSAPAPSSSASSSGLDEQPCSAEAVDNTASNKNRPRPELIAHLLRAVSVMLVLKASVLRRARACTPRHTPLSSGRAVRFRLGGAEPMKSKSGSTGTRTQDQRIKILLNRLSYRPKLA